MSHTFRSRLQVILGEDHVLVRAGIAKLLEREFDLVASASDGRELVQEVVNRKPDVAVVDVGLPVMNGIEAAREIRKAGVETKIVFLSMHSEPDYVVGALRAGGSAYILKHSPPDELTTAIREVMRGRTYITPLIPGNISEMLRRRDGQTEILTARQRQVLQMVAEGYSSREIAGILGTSPKTIEFHRSNVMEKLGARTTAELTRYAIQLGMVTEEGNLPRDRQSATPHSPPPPNTH